MSDQQRGDSLAPWGRTITPNLDRFAKNGLTFTNAFCPSQAKNPAYRETVRDLLGRIWHFARKEKDKVPNPYLTVALAPFGPGAASASE